jgi:hypothetical protein
MTGIFESGAVGIARLSLTRGQAQFAPSVAFKFLVDGDHISENLLLDQSIEAQSSLDFFERAPTNWTINPMRQPIKTFWPIAVKWLSTISNPMFQSVEHLAAIKSDGTKVEKPVYPQTVFLYGEDSHHTDPSLADDFRVELSKIKPGTRLYRMYGRMTAESEQIYLGHMTTESPFVASAFGDRILALRHTKSPFIKKL